MILMHQHQEQNFVGNNFMNKFCKGDQVFVTACAEDLLCFHDFCGTVIEQRDGSVKVRDQDDDVWEVYAWQCELEESYV
jgi:hypothetical protein